MTMSLADSRERKFGAARGDENLVTQEDMPPKENTPGIAMPGVF
ncbi:hypothetical protein [Mycobacterium sp.]